MILAVLVSKTMSTSDEANGGDGWLNKSGGPSGTRTRDLRLFRQMHAKAALYQLSYGPCKETPFQF